MLCKKCRKPELGRKSHSQSGEKKFIYKTGFLKREV